MSSIAVLNSDVAFGGVQWNSAKSSYKVFAGRYEDGGSNSWVKAVSSSSFTLKEVNSILFYSSRIVLVTHMLAVISLNVGDGSYIFAKIVDDSSFDRPYYLHISRYPLTDYIYIPVTTSIAYAGILALDGNGSELW